MGRKTCNVYSRREFLGGLALTGAAAMLGWRPESGMAAEEEPPETTTLRLKVWKSACWAPFHVAEPLLREEGFTNIQYVWAPAGGKKAVQMLRNGAFDLSPAFSAVDMFQVETQRIPLKFLAGLHVGCFALIGSEHVNSVRDLKGKTVWTGSVENNSPHVFFKTIVAYVGLDPFKDIKYAWVGKDEAMRLFREGKLDAFISFPPGPQELMDKGVGRLLVDTNVDRPWSQYFCCMISGHRDFVRKNPIATRRAVRALLLANDIVARDPELATRILIEKKVRKESERKYVLQALKDIPYAKWREYNPEETIRFYALRLRDVGMIRTTPEEFIERHTDWSHLKEMKQELALRW